MRLPLDGPAPGTLPALTGTPIPDPGCVGGDWRPFSVGLDPADGTVYVGGVCNATESQSTSDLRAVVYRVDTPTATPSFTQVLAVPLTYNRVPPAGAPNTNDSNSDWEPWPSPTSILPATTPPTQTRPNRVTPYGPVRRSSESYPQVSAISFDSDGSMQLGFRDLMGDMEGHNVPTENASGAGDAIVQAEVLRACPDGVGGWTLENAGVCGGVTGAPVEPAYGAIGPGGRYFYSPLAGYTFANNLNVLDQPSPGQGGQLQVPGFAELATTTTDPGLDFNTDGLLWQSNASGQDTRSSRFRGLGALADGSFGKANGLGDLTAFTGEAPVQIGNRVWYDTDRDGTQDADEQPIAGLTVELTDGRGNVVATTTTDASGQYVFDVEPGTAYTVQIPLGQPQLTGYELTSPMSGSNDAIDSKGVLDGAFAVATVGPHGVGQNDHTFDFGFVRPPPPGLPRPPPPPPTTPTTPTTPNGVTTPTPPPVVPPARRTPRRRARVTRTAPKLTLRKLASRRTVSPGATVRYTLVLRNTGDGPARDVRLCDDVPAHLSLSGDWRGTARPTASLIGGRVCWTFATVRAGARIVRALTMRVDGNAPVGGVVNTATADRRGVPGTDARARATVRVGGSGIKPTTGGVTG